MGNFSSGNDMNDTSVSHSPLNLGSGGTVEVPKIKAVVQSTGAVAKQADEGIISAGRITSVKTFFTKLHAGAIEFLDEQITKWLKENPDIVIKRTNIVTGEIQGKKVEPNIIMTVWY